MRKSLSASAVILTAFLGTNFGVQALDYDQDITAIFGSGNPQQGWTTYTDDMIQLGLRAKNRTDGTTPNDSAGTYSFPTGTAPASSRAIWNFEFSANVAVPDINGDIPSGPVISDYLYKLSVDLDPSAGTSFLEYNPFLVYTDNSFGDSSTAAGAGVEPGIIGNGLYPLSQNSQNITFLGGNPLLDATYDFIFGAYNYDGDLVGETKMTVVVGEGGARKVPDAGSTFAILGIGVAGLGILRRKFAAPIC